jgi:hypothetical protein
VADEAHEEREVEREENISDLHAGRTARELKRLAAAGVSEDARCMS